MIRIKHIGLYITVVVLMIIIFSADVFAEDESIVASGTCGDHAEWVVTGPEDDLTLTISGYGPMTDYDVDHGGIYAGYGEMGGNGIKVSHIVISYGITRIGDYAFRDLESVKDVVIADSVTEIGEYAFCIIRDLTSVSIPKYTTSIGEGAFASTGLTSVTIPDSVQYMGNGVFMYCGKLKTAVLPEGIKAIPKDTFNECGTLTSVDIPDSVTRIGLAAFYNCISLNEVTLPGNLQEIQQDAFSGCKSITELYLPDTVTEIGYNAFDNCSSMKQIRLSNNITRIDTGVFFACQSLESIEIPEGVTNIGYQAFEYCESLSEIRLPEGVKSLSGEAFKGCSSLRKVYLPVSLSYFHDSFFEYCTALTDVYYAGSKEQFEQINSNTNNNLYIFTSVDIDVHFAIETPIKEAHESFKIENKTIPKEYGYYYKDSYFNKPATEYNHSLATMSLCLAFSTYNVLGVGDDPYENYDQSIKEVLSACGFTGNENERYEQYDFNKKPTASSIGCAIGSKSLEDGTTLIAVAVRSSGYEKEWASNFEVGTSGDHLGFSHSANLVYEDIGNYIESHDIYGDIKIWITGFSRGGAVATQTAAILNKNVIHNTSYTKEDIYAYGFATPAGAHKSSNPESNEYNNIFSVLNYHDIVPLVAPMQWGFKRYGKTLILPYSETDLISARYEQEMKEYFMQFKNAMGASDAEYSLSTKLKINKEDKNLGVISVGVLNRELVNSIAKNIGIQITPDFSLNARQNYRSFYQEAFTNTAEKVMEEGGGFDAGTILLSILSEMSEDTFKKFEGRKLICKTIKYDSLISTLAYSNISQLAKAHVDPLYYLAWMQVMDKNYGSDLTPSFKKGHLRYIKVNCPVDIDVYDKSGNKVASIHEEQLMDADNTELNAYIDGNGQKTIVLPVDEEYSVQIQAREKCNISCSIEEMTGASEEPVRIINYDVDNIEKGEGLTAKVSEFTSEEIEDSLPNGSTAEYTLSNDDGTIDEAAEYRGADEITEHSYTVTVTYDEDRGSVYGTGSYVENSFVQLQAECNQGVEFSGFYVNGDRLEDDDPDNDSRTVRMKVTKDALVEARFISIEEDSIAYGTFDGVDWRITKDYELIIGKEGKTQTFENSYTSEAAYPWYEYRYDIKSVKFAGTVIGSGSMWYMFANFRSLEDINLAGFDTSNVTGMGYMFDGCRVLTELDLSPLDTGNVRSMNNMFNGCTKLETINLSSFDTSKVTNMSDMFSYCSNLKDLDVSEFDTSNVTNMANMFMFCTSINELDVSAFNTSNVTDMSNMFNNCTVLQMADISGFDTTHVRSVRSMFNNCEYLTSVKATGLDLSSCTEMDSMFHFCRSLKTADFGGSKATNLRNVSQMFQYAEDITYLDLSGLNLANARTDDFILLDGMYEETVIKTPYNLSADVKITDNTNPYFYDENGNEYEYLPKNTAESITLYRTKPGKSIDAAKVTGIASKVYTGRALTQKPTVKLDGVTLKSGTDYKLSYKNNTKVGTATVTINGIGAYEGSVKKTFKINPKPTIMKSVTALSKGFTAKWTKKSTQLTGYQLQYCTNSKFKSGYKNVTISSYKTSSKKVTGLKAGKKYYVRIRTFKTISGEKYYSTWSTSKTVTTKK